VTDALLTALEPVFTKYRDSQARREANALLKAVRLAPSLDVAEALLRGEAVPKSRLDPKWRRAYGL
jgi:hypothetical protein